MLMHTRLVTELIGSIPELTDFGMRMSLDIHERRTKCDQYLQFLVFSPLVLGHCVMQFQSLSEVCDRFLVCGPFTGGPTGTKKKGSSEKSVG